MSDSHSIEDVVIIKRTDKAALIDSEETGEVWIPFSAIHDDSEVYDILQPWFDTRQKAKETAKAFGIKIVKDGA
jgi:hypothetical protein